MPSENVDRGAIRVAKSSQLLRKCLVSIHLQLDAEGAAHLARDAEEEDWSFRFLMNFLYLGRQGVEVEQRLFLLFHLDMGALEMRVQVFKAIG